MWLFNSRTSAIFSRSSAGVEMKLLPLLHGLCLVVTACCQQTGCPPAHLPEEQRGMLCAQGQAAVNASTLDQQPACCFRLMPPIKLLETGTSVVDLRTSGIKAQLQTATCASGGVPYANCIDPPAFYTRYANVYTTDYREGIVVLADESVNQTSFGTVRTYVSKMLQWTSRIFPEVRQVLSRAYIRVAIRSCSDPDWTKHPEGYTPFSRPIELGGASRTDPTIGMEEATMPSSCFTQPRFPGALEELFHTIHSIAINEVDRDAYVAILCLAARDSAAGIYTATDMRSPSFYAQTPEQKLQMLLEEFNDDFETTVSHEYFVSALAVWMGVPLGDFYTSPGVTSRAAIKTNLTDLACLLARYVPDVGETDGDYCAITNTSLGPCYLFPGSCFCGAMSDDYLGPPLDKQKCPTIRAIKENSGYQNKSLPANGARFKCSGCIMPSCAEDRGLTAQRVVSSTPSPPSTPSASGSIHWDMYFTMFLALTAMCAYR